MADVKGGGPAFPYSALQPDLETRTLVGSMYADNKGMTLRDYFAAKALPVIMDASDIQDVLSWRQWADRVAVASYEVADAMLKARE